MLALRSFFGRLWRMAHVIAFVLLLLATVGAILGFDFFAEQAAQFGLLLLVVTLAFRRRSG